MAQESDQRHRGESSVLLSDVLGDKRVNTFGSLVRDIQSVSGRLDDPRQHSIVLSPLNSALEALPQKPWEDAGDYSTFGPNAYDGDDGRGRASGNIRRFVERHIVPISPQDWPQGQKVKPVGQDRLIWWEERSGKKMIQPDGICATEVIRTAANGEIWILDGALAAQSHG